MSAKDDTQEYINYLMQGTGASLDYEQLKQELNKDSVSSAQAKTESSISAFHSYLKTQDLDPNISQIAQSAFFSSQTSKPRDLKESANGRKPMDITDLDYSSRGSSPKLKVENVEISQTETLAQLESLGKKLIDNGFSPLHPTLMLATRDNHHVAGTLTDTQALYLISTLSSVIAEYESRGSTIQNLVSQLNSRPISGGEVDESAINFFKTKVENQKKIIEKLEYEKRAAILKEDSNRARNASLLDSIKQTYYFDSPNVEPILATVIESYEQKLESKAEKEQSGSVFNPQISSNSLQEIINHKVFSFLISVV
jgi:transcription initiation factor IIE alpha subunit